MLKTKSKFKLLVALGILLLLGTTRVNAVTEQEAIDSIPNTIHLNISVKENYKNILNGDGYVLDKNKIQETIPDGYSIKLVFENYNIISDARGLIYYNDSLVTSDKFINIKYLDDDKQNATVKQSIEKFVIENSGKEVNYQYTGKLDNTIITNANKTLISELNTKLNINNSEFVIFQCDNENNESLYCVLGIFVNDVYYNAIAYRQKLVSQTIDDIQLNDKENGILLDTTDDIISKDTVMEVKAIENGSTYNKVKTILSDVNKFKVYDITLTSNGVKIQPNGKVKISIPIPTDYDKANLAVYRVADNGDKTKYDIKIEGNYATFETNHFSTYVLAENNITTDNTNSQETPNTQNTNNKTNKEKDNTPKTGNLDIINYVLVVTALAGAGIIVFKKHSK